MPERDCKTLADTVYVPPIAYEEFLAGFSRKESGEGTKEARVAPSQPGKATAVSKNKGSALGSMWSKAPIKGASKQQGKPQLGNSKPVDAEAALQAATEVTVLRQNVTLSLQKDSLQPLKQSLSRSQNQVAVQLGPKLMESWQVGNRKSALFDMCTL